MHQGSGRPFAEPESGRLKRRMETLSRPTSTSTMLFKVAMSVTLPHGRDQGSEWVRRYLQLYVGRAFLGEHVR
ncbi:hypothetical protein N7462_007488 [Penicillium macrosclerotiorum]|uniref:uncharacterized protein n=1 Tax=Penicillium macrosclerotiorum TaxID=303699 RepID=UPI002549A7DE|nr:uncharacterized protein N7462_007488 [Penicillium macrosclerotiorum]KAJ5679244.1 hypothetical protein N7462_007488 [Penicillium macrosclerotiorum]